MKFCAKIKKACAVSCVLLLSQSVYASPSIDTSKFYETLGINSPERMALINFYDKGIASDYSSVYLLSRQYPLTRYELGLIMASTIDEANSKNIEKDAKEVLKILKEKLFSDELSVLTGEIITKKDTNVPIPSSQNPVPVVQSIPTPTISTSVSEKEYSSPDVTTSGLLNFRKDPATLPDKQEPVKVASVSPAGPLDEANLVELEKISPIELSNDKQDSLSQQANASLIDRRVNSTKDFYVTVSHNMSYIDQKANGNVGLDTTNNLDDYGNPVQSTTTNQHQFQETLDIGLAFKVTKFLQVTIGLEAKNENGGLWQKGSTFGIGNFLFNFIPQEKKIDKNTTVKTDGKTTQVNSTNVKVSSNADGTSVVATDGSNIGVSSGENGTSVVLKNVGGVSAQSKDGTTQVGTKIGETNVGVVNKNGETGIGVSDEKGSQATYSSESGFSTGSVLGKYSLLFGKLNTSFSSYSLSLSNVKGIQAGYKDANESLILLRGKPTSLTEGTDTEKGKFDRVLWGFQYATNKLVPSMNLAFNFATSNDSGTLTKPNGATQQKSSVYSVAFKSNDDNGKLQYSGEYSHSINNYNTSSDSSDNKRVGNAFYLDASNQFTSNFGASVHLVNIEKMFDASTMVADISSSSSSVLTNTGDGKPDYLYGAGQKGMDLTANYTMKNGAVLAFGYTNYPLTQDGNSLVDWYVSANKQWKLKNDTKDIGTFNLQQRYERRHVVGDKDELHNTYSSTASLNMEPWKDGELAVDYQIIRDNVDGNEDRAKYSLAHHFYPAERVTVTPQVSYETKKGSGGTSDASTNNNSKMDSKILIQSLLVSYEVIPSELTLNIQFTKSKYNILQSELDASTGEKIDGEKRDVTGTGIGFVWEPTKIPGLTASVGFTKNKVDYYLPAPDRSNQNVFEYTVGYSRPISDNVKASIDYKYSNTRDEAKPQYDEMNRSASISLNATMGESSSINLSHSYEKTYKPLDPKANGSSQTTSLTMSNQF